MKIIDVKALPCDGGYRPWIFVKVVTDEGLVGMGGTYKHGMLTLTGVVSMLSV